MESSLKFVGGTVTPTKEKTAVSIRSKPYLNSSENVDPNTSSPGLKFCNSPPMSSAKKSTSRKAANPNQLASPSPKKKIRERKFVIAKKKSRKEEVNSSSSAAAVDCVKCKQATGKSKCLCVAYEKLRVSQDEFFKNRSEIDNEGYFDYEGVKTATTADQNCGIAIDEQSSDALSESDERNGELSLKRSRDRLMEEARKSVPEPGSGRVKHLVKAFENLRMIPKTGDSKEKENNETDDDNKGIKWALPGMHQSSSSDFFLTSENLGLDSRHSYSLDSNQGSISTRTCDDRRKSRRSSTESTGTLNRRHWKQRQKKATSLKPFMLRTEQRGRWKEEEFMKKLQQMLEEEEKLRIPVAQGLPWTTDEPEFLVKPPVKDNTRPVDLQLHSDMRAVERAEFDHQVAKKMDLIEQYRMERERQQKLAEEEEIRRLRKDLVPKAQPMPYFDRPFMPRRSMKNPTIPKEPKFHLPQHKKIKCDMSLDDDLYTPLE
ncbi:hypothetical protein ABFS82_11G119100 [Erythranthe guttata]|uniref:uncharacterized protein LOC105960922 n=1 Tax=Erythranthe guttata TaxID=4155 RepID=UPI00064DB44A|nr:PREDICTED: uncharacterized protein LOC105960922 [Erythranthe guttata]|eukprot:XP_012840587.1 PREDICTED: uncharacterized protein LOC105960922 [Erythranthe guttata]